MKISPRGFDASLARRVAEPKSKPSSVLTVGKPVTRANISRARARRASRTAEKMRRQKPRGNPADCFRAHQSLSPGGSAILRRPAGHAPLGDGRHRPAYRRSAQRPRRYLPPGLPLQEGGCRVPRAHPGGPGPCLPKSLHTFRPSAALPSSSTSARPRPRPSFAAASMGSNWCSCAGASRRRGQRERANRRNPSGNSLTRARIGSASPACGDRCPTAPATPLRCSPPSLGPTSRPSTIGRWSYWTAPTGSPGSSSPVPKPKLLRPLPAGSVDVEQVR
jgi:hypothetical protein